ncbi:MAG: hypothetical protein K2L07_13140 [Lachnospiraceae bacterium]|nr:hypothetical protein [Lachnospiraceae bacterium]
MRIGLYGMPTAGKTYIMEQIDFIDVVTGSRLLREYAPDFDKRDEPGRKKAREAIAKLMQKRDNFIMDGHYAFGDETAFTEEDGEMYDVFLYLYIDPAILRTRMENSVKNQKYLKHDISEWQKREMEGLRDYCHAHNKDFYILDNPPANSFGDVAQIISFIKAIASGYSCASFARRCANEIIRVSKSDTVVLLDGDKTITIEDSSNAVFGYKTHLYDGNFYTGFQVWKQNEEFKHYIFDELKRMPVHLNEKVCGSLTDDSFILTSGHEKIWRFISDKLTIPFFCGAEMSAETKLYITKLLQDAGKTVVAYGDGMNDYFMLKQADEGYLVKKQNGALSRSLAGRGTEGLVIV